MVLITRWRGDYGGKQGMWFPSNYVEEVEPPSQPVAPATSGQDDVVSDVMLLRNRARD